jgi:Flp pilus assembly pilin Flp
MHSIVLRLAAFLTALRTPLRTDERGVTTVEWLGMAAIVVIVVAFLLPQVRSAAASMWNSIVGELNGLFA